MASENYTELRLAPDAFAPPSRCEAIARNGRRCRCAAQAGKRYCHQHANSCGTFGDPMAPLIKRLHAQHKRNAKSRGIRFLISPEDVTEMFARAGGACEVTGVPFEFGVCNDGRRRAFFPSIDRIDSSDAYTKTNCRLVAACANLAMNVWGHEVLHRMAASMVETGRLRPPGS